MQFQKLIMQEVDADFTNNKRIGYLLMMYKWLAMRGIRKRFKDFKDFKVRGNIDYENCRFSINDSRIKDMGKSNKISMYSASLAFS